MTHFYFHFFCCLLIFQKHSCQFTKLKFMKIQVDMSIKKIIHEFLFSKINHMLLILIGTTVYGGFVSSIHGADFLQLHFSLFVFPPITYVKK